MLACYGCAPKHSRRSCAYRFSIGVFVRVVVAWLAQRKSRDAWCCPGSGHLGYRLRYLWLAASDELGAYQELSVVDAYGSDDIFGSRLRACWVLARFGWRNFIEEDKENTDMNPKANKVLEPTAAGAFTMNITHSITLPASVTPPSPAVAQRGR